MNVLEIIFTLSGLALLGMWGWFIMLAFNTSRIWGLWLILFFPISPLVFAYRFERKTRKIIYYFAGSLLLFVLINAYIIFTNVGFFDTFVHKIGNMMPKIEKPTSHASSAAKIKKLNLPKPTPIPPPRAVPPKEDDEEEVDLSHTFHSKPAHRYKSIEVDSLQNYVGKDVIVTTAVVEHRGKLLSVSGSQIEIKKSLNGGTTTMGVLRSKIEKAQVFL